MIDINCYNSPLVLIICLYSYKITQNVYNLFVRQTHAKTTTRLNIIIRLKLVFKLQSNPISIKYVFLSLFIFIILIGKYIKNKEAFG